MRYLSTINVNLLSLTTGSLRNTIRRTILLNRYLKRCNRNTKRPAIKRRLNRITALLRTNSINVSRLGTYLTTLLNNRIRILLLRANTSILLIKRRRYSNMKQLIIMRSCLVCNNRVLCRYFLSTFKTMFLAITKSRRTLRTTLRMRRILY